MRTSTHTSPVNRTAAFVLLVVTIVTIAVGHLYLITDFTSLYVGVPLWLWFHLGVLALLLILAWIAIDRILFVEAV